MKTRIITGAGYVAVMVAFFLLRELVDPRIFHILIGFMIISGTFECARMMKGRAVGGIVPIAVTYSALFVAS
jgi:hypothetical protein